jgi:hypothetical protein
MASPRVVAVLCAASLRLHPNARIELKHLYPSI